jgi:uncharacterized membrane protein (DUF4010 family)
VWIPIAAAGVVALLYCVYLYLSDRTVEKDDQQFSNPFDLVSAIKFGLLYAVILVVARTGQLYFGDTGVYISSLLSGLADVDAITISLAQLNLTGTVSQTVAAQSIVIATLANTLAKGAIVVIGGATLLKRALLPGMLLVLLAAVISVILLV